MIANENISAGMLTREEALDERRRSLKEKNLLKKEKRSFLLKQLIATLSYRIVDHNLRATPEAQIDFKEYECTPQFWLGFRSAHHSVFIQVSERHLHLFQDTDNPQAYVIGLEPADHADFRKDKTGALVFQLWSKKRELSEKQFMQFLINWCSAPREF